MSQLTLKLFRRKKKMEGCVCVHAKRVCVNMAKCVTRVFTIQFI